MHPTGHAGFESDVAPFRLFLALEFKRFAFLYARHHAGFGAFAGANVDESVRVINHSAKRLANKRRKRQEEGDEA